MRIEQGGEIQAGDNRTKETGVTGAICTTPVLIRSLARNIFDFPDLKILVDVRADETNGCSQVQ